MVVNENKKKSQNRLIYCEVTDRASRTFDQTVYAYDAFGRRVLVKDKGEAALRTLYDGFGFDVIKTGPVFENGMFTDSQNTGIRWSNNGRPTGSRYRYLDDTDVKDSDRYFYLDENTYTTVNSRYRGERTELFVNGTLTAQTTYDYGTGYFSTDFGYLGKQHDPTAALYNYGYRDYKPSAAPFTSQDPIRDGSNWFIYVNNDPVNHFDILGLCEGSDNKRVKSRETGFDNIEEAAIDWAKTYADDSIHDDREYASAIYSFETKDGTKYSYTIPLQGTRKSSQANTNLKQGQTLVSEIHSHGSYDPNYNDLKPSRTDYEGMLKDIETFQTHQGIEYVVTPDGSLKSYDVNKKLKTIDVDLPKDPKSVFYSSVNNSYIDSRNYDYYNQMINAQAMSSWSNAHYKKDEYIQR